MARTLEKAVTLPLLERYHGMARGEFAGRSAATQASDGLMSAADKRKLDELSSWRDGLVDLDGQEF